MRLDRRTVLPTVVACTAVVALAAVAAVAAHVPAPRSGAPAPVTPTASPTIPGGGRMPAPPQPFPVWAAALGVVALLAVMVPIVVFVVRHGIALRRRPTRVGESAPGIDEAPEQFRTTAAAETAVSDAVDRLDAGADPREVVIACWVRLEAAADAAGLGRRPAETASDVARRWLAATPGARSAAVDDLAALFHEARYSTHPVTDAQRERARVALAGITGARA